MFRMARYAVLNKIDLLPHLDFDVDEAIACARQVNPALRFFLTSARTGEGLEEWFDFLRQQVHSGLVA
jgi:hydrogenase nickel incorporation protein HypB